MDERIAKALQNPAIQAFFEASQNPAKHVSQNTAKHTGPVGIPVSPLAVVVCGEARLTPDQIAARLGIHRSAVVDVLTKWLAWRYIDHDFPAPKEGSPEWVDGALRDLGVT